MRIGSLAAATLLALAIGCAGTGTRVVDHAMGRTVVQDAPQRVVILTNEGTEALLALGVMPAGAVRSWHGNTWYEHLEGQLAGTVPVGTEFDLDFEKLRAIGPDLIIANKLRHADMHDELSAIAPTVMSDVLYGNWKTNLLFYGRVLGREARAEELLEAFDRKAETLSRQLRPHLADRISLVRFMPDETWAYARDSFGGTILAQLGFARPALQDVERFTLTVTPEQIPLLDGERLLYFAYETGDGASTRQAQRWISDPRWKALAAVKSNHAIEVSDAVWTTAGGIMAAHLLLDDVARLYGVED